MTLLLEARGISKRFGGVQALKDVSLTINEGEIYGLIGPDGSGKSSLMKAIAGVLTYDEGRVKVFGTVIDSERAAERVKHRLGFLPQGLGLNLYPDLSVEENIDMGGYTRNDRAGLRAEVGRRIFRRPLTPGSSAASSPPTWSAGASASP